jgi:NADP-reducing hydrogenase subunit HndB
MKVKSIEDLKLIRENAVARLNLGYDRSGARVVVGLATCGIAAGAVPVMDALVSEVNALGDKSAVIAKTGCIGMCRLEPIVEVTLPGKEKVTYVHVTPEKARLIAAKHIAGGKPVEEYTIGAIEKEDA